MTIAKKPSKKIKHMQLFDKGTNDDVVNVREEYECKYMRDVFLGNDMTFIGGKVINHAIPNLSEATIQDVSDMSKCISCDVVESWLHLVKWSSECVRDTVVAGTLSIGKLTLSPPISIPIWNCYTLLVLHPTPEEMDTGICLIPVFKPGHWCLAIAYMGERRLELYDPKGMTGIGVLNQIEGFLKYLRYKWQTDDSLEGAYEKRVMREGQVPIQEDSTSCAIFLCVIANNVAAGEGIDNFGQKDIPIIRQGIAKLLRGLYGYGNWDEADGNGSRGSDTGSGRFHQAKASHSEPAAATAEVRVMSAIEIM
ncbi:hypothetical protein GUITHDRAFT_105251 [Guillardia theta CCMP2712]|uniref:Ubiquitin-like protease family profile domain-containing protein n=1 Tax=Guillardia theta (strain CCMP2712) TaxID=905079 RepID=L1JLF1_GUITC|nr:hypothetical protein GUITHDRAFT_105251 [Guillardia theta CCMP2712]EKX49177.1 hypothetical protein GUITHDRAFT_105251 [Guillardia theta CCMP2712]|eukprot:XP_005836157.1 hypothetical protein GUITHDRAFT_105251 [Guillardia theta CCMP2712]